MRIKKAYQGTAPENKIVGTYTDSNTDVYNCAFVNDALDNLETHLNNNFIRGNPITLEGNRSYLIVVKVFTTVVDACGIGVVLGGYNIKWIYSNGFSASANGYTWTFSSGYGSCQVLAIPIT